MGNTQGEIHLKTDLVPHPACVEGLDKYIYND